MTSAILTQGLCLSFGGFSVLADVDLELPDGAFVAVLGPNGGGKSTLLKILLGLLKPTAGRAEVLGYAPDKLPPALVGYVPQLKTLDRTFPAVSCDLVESGSLRRWPWRLGGRTHDEAEAALEQVGAGHLTHRPLSVLSGGELQRVYLARALMRRPRLVLLDEPAAGIDLTGGDQMFRVLEDYRAATGATIVMVTHDWGAAYHHAGCALLLNKHVIVCGPPVEALSDENLRQAFGHSGHAHTMSWDGRAPAAEEHAHD